ncbi:MAG: DUF131 domain-containing protein [Candidatus Aenigmarchaeota archaeon]|nr:DUF131 domain-containing protein [Candidatus Aenigmarchaeota archaeon]
MTEINLVTVGVLLMFIGFAAVIAGSMLGKGDAKVAVGGFIGPIPFGWANDPKMLQWIIALALSIAVIFILFSPR